MSNKRVVVITGCSSGIGFKSTLKFAQNGYITYASVRNLKSQGALDLQRISKKENLPLQIIKIDVTKEESVKKGISKIIQKEKRIDVLVNNAGFGFLGPLELFTVEEIKEQHDTNIFGMIRMVKQVIPQMRKQRSGYIINMSSISGLISFPLWGVYSSSKFAIETLTEVLRFELGHFGIKVALVEPGSFMTNFISNIKHPKTMNETKSPYKTMTEHFFGSYYKVGERAKKSFLARFIRKPCKLTLKASFQASLINPDRVVDTIYSIAQAENPKLRNVVGIDSQVYLFLKRILPYEVWEWILHKIYKW